jgi:hypothetical protein
VQQQRHRVAVTGGIGGEGQPVGGERAAFDRLFPFCRNLLTEFAVVKPYSSL